MAKVLITKDVWDAMVGEVDYFASLKKEANFYAIFGFVKKPEVRKAPWEMITLDDIDYFALTHVYLIPRRYAKHSLTLISYKFSNKEEESEFYGNLYGWEDAIIARHQNLEMAGVHSHPFAKNITGPSGSNGDYSRMLKYLERIEPYGLSAIPEVIFCQSADPALRWNACAYSLDENKNIASLGYAEVVSPDDKRIKRIFTPPFRERRIGRIWEWWQKRIKGFEKIEKSSWGWHICRIRLNEFKTLFVYLPPDFPNCGQILYQQYDSSGKKWEKIFAWTKTQDKECALGFINYDLRRLVRQCNLLNHLSSMAENPVINDINGGNYEE